MIDSYWRSPYQTHLINPLLIKLTKWKLSPHLYTLLALLLGLAIIPLLLFNYPYAALFCLIGSGFIDTIDGSIARAQQMASPKGAVFDIVSDRVVEAAVILGLYCVAPSLRGVYCLLMLSSTLLCVTTFLVVGIFIENESEKSFFYSPGIMERAEAFFLFGLMILFPSLFPLFAVIFFTLVFLTALIRVWQFARQA